MSIEHGKNEMKQKTSGCVAYSLTDLVTTNDTHCTLVYPYYTLDTPCIYNLAKELNIMLQFPSEYPLTEK